MTAAEINAGLKVLRNYYADAKGTPHTLNDVQLGVYLDGLGKFTTPAFETASRMWMRKSQWFPKLSDLLELLDPAVDVATQAGLAWSAVERAISSVGSYRAVQFADPAIGECVRLTFGSWARACSFDFNSPGWHSRRQQFVAMYPSIARRSFSSSPVLNGLHRDQPAALVAHVEGLPDPSHQLTAGDDRPLDRHEAAVMLAKIERDVAARRQA